MAMLMIDMMQKYMPEHGMFVQQYNYKQGIQKYGEKAEAAAVKEV